VEVDGQAGYDAFVELPGACRERHVVLSLGESS
jgi:hypothetical protein